MAKSRVFAVGGLAAPLRDRHSECVMPPNERNVISMRRRFSAVLAMASAVALAAVGMAGPASAETGQSPAGTKFRVQTANAGLSGKQAGALQAKVDKYLREGDGRQVSANRIELSNGASLVLTVPGEKYARDLGAPNRARTAAAWECAYENFCMYRGENGTGDRLSLFYCRDHALTNWTGRGSFYNNQTPGTRAQLKDRNRNVVYTTLGAPSHHPSFNWDPIWYVKPC